MGWEFRLCRFVRRATDLAIAARHLVGEGGQGATLCMECGAEMRWTEGDFDEGYWGETFTAMGVSSLVCKAPPGPQVSGHHVYAC